MQTDLAFMHYTIRSRKASIVYDGDADVNSNIKWEHLVSDFLTDVLHRLSAWHIIVRACRKVSAEFKQHDGGVGIGDTPQSDVAAAMQELEGELGTRLRMQNHVFDQLLPSMSPMKARFKAFQAGGAIRHSEASGMDSMEPTDRLAYLIYSAQRDVMQGSSHLSMTFDMLERELLSQGPASLVDKRMLDQLSDISTMDEMLQSMFWNQLGFSTFNMATARTPQQVHQQVIGRSMNRGVRLESRTITRIARLLRHFSEAPWPKGRKSIAWLQAATESRRRFTAFWAAVREELWEAQVKSGMDMARSALGTINFDTELEHLVQLDQEFEECAAVGRAAEEAALAVSKSLTEPHGTLADRTGSSEDARPLRRKRTKAKAAREHGGSRDDVLDACTEDLTLDDQSSEDEAITNVEPIAVKQDSISVFRKMFPSDGVEGGGVRWSQLVQAMTDAGMTATASGGSAVSFSNGSKTVVFHKPHPDPFVDPIVLQGMGKRLRKRMGWYGERFAVRTKDAEGS